MKYIIDLDGTLLDGEKANKDSVEFMREIQEKNIDFLIMTNSIKSPRKIYDRLKEVGIKVQLDQIINPICAMNIYLKKNAFDSAYVIASKLEIDQLEITINETNPSIVILLDFEKENVGYSSLQKIFEFMKRGIPVITASKSLYYTKSANKYLDTGAFVSLLERVSGLDIEVIGKPSEAYFESGVSKLNTKASDVMVVGDDWQTDVLGAKKIGCHSTLIKSGKYVEGDEDKIGQSRCISKLMDLLK